MRGRASLAALVGAGAVLAAPHTGSAAVEPVHFNRTDIPVSHVEDIELAPIDGDADADVIACNRDFPSVLDMSFLPNQRGYFRFGERETEVGDHCIDLVAIHLDGDGVLDVAVSEWYRYEPTGDPELVTLLGNGDGTFAEAARYPLEAPAEHVVSGDFDADGDADVAAGESADRQVEVFIGRGDGTLDPPVARSVGSRLADLETGDLDGNGADDVVGANRASSDLSLLAGEPATGLGEERRLEPVDHPVDVELLDLQADGDLDIAALARSRFARFLLSDGEGSFAPGGRVATGRGATLLASADFNADSWPDLVVTWPDELAVFFGRVNGGFTRPTAVAPGPWLPGAFQIADSIAVGAVNGDPLADILAPTPGLKRFLATRRLIDCRGRTANVVGSEGDDDLIARESLAGYALVIGGRDGDDASAGGPRRDVACLGDGDDSFYSARSGADVILGGKGDDRPMKGGTGDDRILGGPGDDLLGRHQFNNEGGDDRLDGGPGRDLLDGGPGWDICIGGPGHDGAVDCEREVSIP